MSGSIPWSRDQEFEGIKLYPSSNLARLYHQEYQGRKIEGATAK